MGKSPEKLLFYDPRAYTVHTLNFYQESMPHTIAENHQHSYAVIMAGGAGQRLWPLSRTEKPKQFQRFVSDKTMIQETFARVAEIVPADNIFVSTTKNYVDLVLEQLPSLTREKLIIEPESRNTAPAIALSAAFLSVHDPQAVVATVASDHAIENPEEFTATLDAALSAAHAHRDKLVIVGINPTRADTGLGYIKMGKEFETVRGKRVFFADAFEEKPDAKTAERYLADWAYLWNAGYFIFSAHTFLQWVREFSPELSRCIEAIARHRSAGTLDDTTFQGLYSQVPSAAVEPLIVERLSPEKRLVVPSALKWSDVGSWGTLFSFLQEKTGAQMVTHGNHLDLGSKETLVYGEKRLIATLGLEDIIIVDTKDALLVARRDQVSGEIKKLIEKLKAEGKESYL